MDERQINKRLRREFRTPGWLLIAYFVLMNVLVMVAMVGDMFSQIMASFGRGEFMPEPDMEALMNNAWGYLWAVAVAMLFLFMWKDRSFWSRGQSERPRDRQSREASCPAWAGLPAWPGSASPGAHPPCCTSGHRAGR